MRLTVLLCFTCTLFTLLVFTVGQPIETDESESVDQGESLSRQKRFFFLGHGGFGGRFGGHGRRYAHHYAPNYHLRGKDRYYPSYYNTGRHEHHYHRMGLGQHLRLRR